LSYQWHAERYAKDRGFKYLTPSGAFPSREKAVNADKAYDGQNTGAALYGLRERNSMARVRDVAAYIISKLRSVDVMKLQKLLYYSQAWSLVVRKAFKTYQGQYKVSSALEGDKTSLTEDDRGTVDAILRFNRDKEGFYLRELTHKEDPWMDAP